MDMPGINEFERQLVHINLGLACLLLLALVGKTALALIVSATLVSGMALMHLKMRGNSLPFVDPLIDRFERTHTVPGYGSLWYNVGVLLTLTLLVTDSQIASALIILALGDGMSTIVGSMHGTHRIAYNKKKTWEGALAFALFSLPALMFTGWLGLLAVVFASFVETLPLKIDDNLTIPLACVVVFRILV
jgi:dolichol kinase